MRKLQIVWLLLIMVSTFLSSASPLLGQAVTGSITGYITDPSGAAVPGANVVATDVRSSLATSRTSDSAGLYLITNLLPGAYTVAVEAKGFKTFTQQRVQLEVGATVRIDVNLQLGEVTQQITVEARAATMETEKTDVSRKFSNQEVDSLPTVGRNVTQLFTLVPGAVRDTFQMGVGENPSENNRVYVNGQWSGAQTYTLDGISDVAYGFAGLQVIVPIQDSVQEMKITTADYDPEFGQTSGMVAQYITKSGTNQVHGSLFYFNRNKSTFAADPITEKIAGTGPGGKGLGVAPFNFNQWGGSLGGPIKKNKVFLFGATQWNRLRQGSSMISTVPNADYRAGDFSSLAATHPIYDPTTGNPDGTGRTQFFATSNPADATYNPACTGAAPCLNMVPTSRIDSVATNLLGILPGTNAGAAGATDNNFVGGIHEIFNQWQVDTRSDINLSDKDKFFARYSMFKAHLENPPLFGVEAGGPSGGGLSPEVGDFTNQHGAINWTHTFGPSLLMEVRGGVSRFRLDAYQADSNLQTNNKVGIPNINTGDRLSGGLAGINVAGPVGGWFMGIPSGVGIPRFDRTTNFEGVNNWSWMHSNHQFRFGLQVVRERFNFLSVNASSRGNFSFSQAMTGDAGAADSGLGMATFLLGMPSAFDRALLTQFPQERQTRWGIYGQDTWRATKKLTLTLGLRWDYYTPITPGKPGGLVNWDPDTNNLLLAGLGKVSNSAGVFTSKTNFAPRVGLAYRLTNKTVLRAGFGRSYFSSGYDATFYHLTSSYPIVAQQSVQQPTLYTEVFPIDQGPPAGTPPVFPSSGMLQAPDGTGIKPRPFDWKTETMDSWNFTIERQVLPDTTVSLGYVGAKGTHLSLGYNINAADIGPGPLLDRRPYYQKFGLSQSIGWQCNCSDSNYNSLQVQVKKSYAKNLSLTANFVWQKALGYNSNNPYNRTVDYGPGGNNINTNDRAVTFTLGHTYVFPYGKGQRWGSDASGIKNAVIGGWQFSGVTVLNSGGSLTPGISSNATLNADFGQRADRVPGCDPRNVPGGQNRHQWYNQACFAIPAQYHYGNAGVGSLRGPGIANADFALWKEFGISTILNREKTAIQLRVESFNVFNRTNLGSPADAVWIGTNTDTSSGAVISSLATGFPMRRFEFGAHISW